MKKEVNLVPKFLAEAIKYIFLPTAPRRTMGSAPVVWFMAKMADWSSGIFPRLNTLILTNNLKKLIKSTLGIL
jgi:hypothetical protein